MSARGYLDTAADALVSAMPDVRGWPADLDESAPVWADLMKQLGAFAQRVAQGAVSVRDTAEAVPGGNNRALAAKADLLVSALNATTAARADIDRKWRGVAYAFSRARTVVPAQEHRPLTVVGPVGEAARAVRNAARARLAPSDIKPALDTATSVCEALAGAVDRIAAAVARREREHVALAGISRALRRGVHGRCWDTAEYFAAAAQLYAELTFHWPGRWPNHGV